MKKIKFYQEDINKICNLYKDGFTLNKIGEIFNISDSTICRILKQNNIKIRTNSEAQKIRTNKYIKIIYSEFEFIPIRCQCPCNNLIKLEKKNIKLYERLGYPKFIHGHSNKCYNIFAQGDFCFIPYKCACGCNNIIPLNPNKILRYEKYGYPQYINYHRIRCFNEEIKEKKAISIKRSMAKPENKIKRANTDKLPEVKKKRSLAAKKQWEDPEYRRLHTSQYHPRYKGGKEVSRRNHYERRKQLGYYPLNQCIGNGKQYIKGFERHHVNYNDIIYVPKGYNQEVIHRLSTGFNMEIVNTRAYFFLVMNYIEDLNKLFIN